MVHVVLAGSEGRAFTGGATEFEVEAVSVRRLITALESLYPGLGTHVSRRMAVAIDGEIHQDADEAALTSASEVYLIPRIGGG